MHEFTVKYYLSDEIKERLERILKAWKSRGEEDTLESLFSFMMVCGSVLDIDKRLQTMERQLGLDK